MRPPEKTLIVGIGNYLMGDEGIGVHIAKRLSKAQLPDGVEVLDGGTGGFHLLGYLENYNHVILMDATLDAHPPGTIRLIKPKFTKDFPPAMSTHDIGLKDLITALQLLDKMPDIDLIVVSIESVQQQGIELTTEIENSIPVVTEMINKILQNLYRCKVTSIPVSIY
ncbi:MAG: hydrogenase maturation protease [Chitinophagales bacterium]